MSSSRFFCAVVCLLALAHASRGTDFECRWAASPPVIDGKLDDPAWKNAQVIEEFTAAWLPEGQRKPPTATKARLLWDREYLYFSAEMEDWDVFANVTEQDAAIWTCDVFELFFKPAKDKPGYYEFEVNAANGKLDMFLPSRGAGGYLRHARERDFHMESAVQVHGTLNNWSDMDKGWTVEGRIPWRDFLPTGGRPAPDEVWMHSLCRYDYSAGLENHALSTNTPVASATNADFHRYEDYVPLKFIGPREGAAIQRVPWDTSRLVGSPEPPLPFHGVSAFPKLKTNQPITITADPGRDSFLLIEMNGYVPVRKARLCRLANDASATEPEVLLELGESLYDVCFHPRFAENGYLYLGANGRFGEGRMDFNNRVLRYTMDRKTGRIDPASRQVLMEWHSHGHNGMALTFGRDGMLYITSGDGTSECDEWNSGQDLTRLLAKLLRIDVDHPADGRPYGIPADNPFLKTEGARPETWAYGFRNPWRMTMDRATGDLWVGENGQDLWEYARIVHRGENYGWPLMEGSHELQPHRKAGPTPFSKPLIEHPHTDFRSLTGGIVYRGTKFADLAGCYVYGDHSTGQIWAAKQEGGKLIEDQQIAKTSYGITGFCETPQGDILIVDYLGNAIHKLERAIRATTALAAPFPAKLSDTGLFTDTAGLTPHPALLRYEVNAPAWHDGAVSERYIALPGTERMEFNENGGWNFPNGTVVVQTLSLQKKRIETRVLLRQENEWSGYSYVWNDTQTDAVRAPVAGETRQLASQQSWRVPGRQECMFCHSRAANFVLGVSTVQLNRAGADGENQIAKWEREGLLKFNHAATEESEWRGELGGQNLSDEAVQARMDLLLPTALQRQPRKDSPLLARAATSMPRIVDPKDTGASLHDRARAYLHANCSQCHVRSGGGNSNMQLASNFADKDMEILNATPLHTTFGIPDAQLAAPGAAGRSVLIYRPAVRGPGQMPPVGTMAPDAEGIALLSQWIDSLPAHPAPAAIKSSKP
jgi:glucose/arabinose dehydrogenase/mono/diheme cytochrome c family protein